MNRPAKIQGVIMGIDYAVPGSDKTVYFCSRHRNTSWRCIQNFLKAQDRERANKVQQCV